MLSRQRSTATQFTRGEARHVEHVGPAQVVVQLVAVRGREILRGLDALGPEPNLDGQVDGAAVRHLEPHGLGLRDERGVVTDRAQEPGRAQIDEDARIGREL